MPRLGVAIKDSVEWSFPVEPRRQVVFAADGRAKEMEPPKPFGAQRIVRESQMQDTEDLHDWALTFASLIVTVLWFFLLK